ERTMPRVGPSHEEMARKMSSRWQSFANVRSLARTLGSYCQFSQTIHLCEVDEASLLAAFSGGDYATRREVRPLLAHEYRHFGDHVGTLWGRENLVRIFDAYNIRALVRKHEFGRVTQVLRDHRGHHLSSYYTEEHPKAVDDWDGKPWRYEFSCGFHVNADGSDKEGKPILFTRFWTFDGEPLCRVPFSVSSLLEVRARAHGIFESMGLMLGMPVQGA